ncbi:hypothetical protein C8F01DRAFT_1095114 [Mycena amicta]|nr:hypothetical protein C8F01DRAFT_1095114 [Mycena amicta]
MPDQTHAAGCTAIPTVKTEVRSPPRNWRNDDVIILDHEEFGAFLDTEDASDAGRPAPAPQSREYTPPPPPPPPLSPSPPSTPSQPPCTCHPRECDHRRDQNSLQSDSRPGYTIEGGEFVFPPDKDTVTKIEGFNLMMYGVVVNRLHRLLICTTCGEVLHLSGAQAHITVHAGELSVPSNLVTLLRQQFNLQNPGDVDFITNRPAPIFGLRCSTTLRYFCGSCRHGFSSRGVLSSHQTQKDHRDNDADFFSPAQQLQRGQKNSFFAVEPEKIPPSAPEPSPLDALRNANHGPPDWSTAPICPPSSMLELTSLSKQEGWLDLVKGKTPEELVEARRLSTELDGDLHDVHDAVVGFPARFQGAIAGLAGFGLQKLLAQVGEIEADSCKRYGRTLWGLVFALLRQIRGQQLPFVYPLNDEQTQALLALSDGIRRGRILTHLIQDVVLALFSHRSKADNEKFFNAVNCYAVICCFNGAAFHLASTITSIFAQLVYCNRGAQLIEMQRLQELHQWDLYEAYEARKIYLTDMQPTPMSFLYNAYCRVKVAQTDEYVTQDGHWHLENTIFNMGDLRIEVAKLSTAVDTLLARYDKIIAEEVFFGETNLPPEFDFTKIIPHEIHDNLRNREVGHCFLDNPKNPFHGWDKLYVTWLLSDPERAKLWCKVSGGVLLFDVTRVTNLMKALDRAADLLLLAVILGSPVAARGAEFSREHLRNTSGCPIRNILVLLGNICYTAINDKTSQYRMKERFNPAASPIVVSQRLVINWGIFRPWQVLMAQLFLTPEDVHRFHLTLHPRLGANITSPELSSMLGVVTEQLMNAHLTFTPLRKFLTSLSQLKADPKNFRIARQYAYDIVGNHSSETSAARYQQANGSLLGIPTDHLRACIWHCDDYQTFTGINHGVKLYLEKNLELDKQAAIFEPENVADVNVLAERIIDKFAPRISVLVSKQIEDATLKSQSIYFPRPKPQYAPYELRDFSDIIIAPQRLMEYRNAVGRPNAQFKIPEQGLMWEKIATGTNNLLINNACGSGKTEIVLAAIKAFQHRGTVVWIHSLSSQHEEINRRAREIGLIPVLWSSRSSFDPTAPFVYAPVEYFHIPEFRQYLTVGITNEQIWLNIFDEIQRLETDRDFRDVFEEIPLIGRLGGRVLGLSGSLPPALRHDFFRHIGIDTWDIIKTPISRSNLFIKIHRLSAATFFEAFTFRMKAMLKRYKPEERMMIFTRSREEAAAVALELNTNAYLSAEDPAGKDRNNALYNDWRSGTHKALIGTSILVAGIDYPHVRHVFFYGFPHNAYDYQQGSDRAGRDGKAGGVHLFLKDTAQVERLNDPDSQHLGLKELADLGRSNACLRIPMPKSTFPRQRCLSPLPPPRRGMSSSRLAVQSPIPADVLQHPLAPQQHPVLPHHHPLGGICRPGLIRYAETIESSASKASDGPRTPGLHAQPHDSIWSKWRQRPAMQDTGNSKRPRERELTPPHWQVPPPPSIPPSKRKATGNHVNPPGAKRSAPPPPTGPPPQAPTAPLAAAPDSMGSRPPGPAGAPQAIYKQRKGDLDRVFNLALGKLLKKCAMCWALGYDDKHKHEACTGIETSPRDAGWMAWSSYALKIEGYCYYCLIPQASNESTCRNDADPYFQSRVNGWHPFVERQYNCPHRDTLRRVLYAFFTARHRHHRIEPIHCPHIPEELLTEENHLQIEPFMDWLAEDATRHATS